MWNRIKGMAGGTSALLNQVFDRAVRETGAVLDSEAANQLKASTQTAIATAKKVSVNLTDLNGDGQFNSEDIKLAAEKAGIAWDKIDPDIKSAMLAGGAAGIGVNFIPFVGQAIAIPTFVGTTAYFYVIAKLRGIGRK